MRTTLRSAARKAQTNSSRATLRKASKNTGLWQYLEHVDVMHSETHTDIERAENYGFSSVPHDQDEEEGQQGQGEGQSQSSSGSVGGGAGSDPETGKQPKGDSAEVIVQYLNGSRSHPVAVVVGDRRHRVISKKNKEGKETEGGDVYMHRGKDDITQIMLRKKGLYQVTRDDRKVRIALVPKPTTQNPSQQQQANGAPGGGAQSGSGQGKQKDYGQEPQYDKADKSDIYINVEKEGDAITIKHGLTVVKLDGKKALMYYEDDTKSTRVDDKHVHIRFKDFRIWVDKEGCWSTVPIQIKQDTNDS